MFDQQNLVVVFLAIILSFLLCWQGGKINHETTEYGQILAECEREGRDYRCVSEVGGDNKTPSGVPYGVLRHRMEKQKLLLINPIVFFITTLFVCFAVSKSEILFSLAASAPVLIYFLRFFPYGKEVVFIPVYLFVVIFYAFLLFRLKRFCFVKLRKYL
jgi:hypothetical protein